MPRANAEADARRRKQHWAEPLAARDCAREEAFYCVRFLDFWIHHIGIRLSHRTGGLCMRTFRLTELCSRTIQFSLPTPIGGFGFAGRPA